MADLQSFIREHQTAVIGVAGGAGIALLIFVLKRNQGNTTPAQFTPIQGIGSYITGYPTANNPPPQPTPAPRHGTGLDVPALFKGAAPPTCPPGMHPQFYRGAWRCYPNAQPPVHYNPPDPIEYGNNPPPTGPARSTPFASQGGGVENGNLGNIVTVGKGKISMKALN